MPKKVEKLQDHKIAHIAGGWRHSLACDDSGTLFSWGWNKFGQLGLGHNSDTCEPSEVKLPDEEKVETVASGWRHTLVVSKSGKFFSWGRGVNGQLGTGSTSDVNSPVEIKELSSETLSVNEFLKQSHPVVMHSIPASDRYALVPDPGPASHAVPEAEVPSSKKPKTI